MRTYRLETTVTEDGKIILPRSLKKMFAHPVEVIITDKSNKKSKGGQDIPAYSCGGKIRATNFSREEIYDYRL